MDGRRKKREEDFLRRSRAAAAGALFLSCLGSASARGGEAGGPSPSASPSATASVSASEEADALVAEALAKNPDLAAARQEAAAARARVPPAGSLPDPMLTVNYENDGVSPSLGVEPMSRLQFMAQQAIPFPGKLGLQERIAKADADRSATRPERAMLVLEAAVRRGYATLLEARENLRLVDEQVGTWREIEEVVRVRYSAGMGTQQDVLRAQSERTRLLQQRRRDESAEERALVELRRILFRPADAPVPTERRLVPGEPLAAPPAEEFLKIALETTPELREAALAKESSRLTGELARRNLRPDFVASAAYMNRGSMPLMWSAGVGVSVPLWAGRKQRPLIVEARNLFEAASATEASLRRQALARTEERLIRIRQLTDESRLDSEALLVQDRLTVDAALASYRTGSVPFVTVLEALSTKFTDRRAAVARLADLLRADADLREFSLDGGPSSSATKSPALSAGSAPRM
ncbi:MAG: TolC family protein [Thermoanaerobaculia bacterium]|nr:TolC family protein [Thermoanaerobaculia bacterium]